MKKEDIAFKLGELTEKLTNLDIHFTNHLHNHKIDRVLNVVYTLVVILMFCWLRWGSH